MGVVELAKGLKANAKLESLELGTDLSIHILIGNNAFGNEGAQALAELLKANRTLTELDICNNTMNDLKLKIILEMQVQKLSRRLPKETIK